MIQFHIDGAAELERQLKEFPVRLQRRVLRSAIRAAVAEIGRCAREIAPVGETGLLRKGIRWRVSLRRGRLIGTVRSTSRHGHLVELGHKTRGGEGWVPAHPYLSVAFDLCINHALGTMMERIREFLNSESGRKR